MVAEQFREVIERPFSATTTVQPTLAEVVEREFSKLPPEYWTVEHTTEYAEIMKLCHDLDERVKEFDPCAL